MESLPSDLKHLFVEWLQEAAINATKKGTKAALLYNKALDRVRNYPLAIDNPKTLKLIQFVGDKTVVYLSDKLKTYCEQNGFGLPAAFGGSGAENSGNKRKNDLDETDNSNEKPKRQRKPKQYIPRKRSGGYAILLALYLGDKERKGLRKEEIILYATPYSDKSFNSNPSANEFYSAWSSIKILQTHFLVDCSGRSPRMYFLSDEGFELAKRLKETEGLHSSPASNQIADYSFDNDVRATPDNSRIMLELYSSPLDHAKTKPDMLTHNRFDSTRTSNFGMSLSPRLMSFPLKPKEGIQHRKRLAEETTACPIVEENFQSNNGPHTQDHRNSKSKLVHDAANKTYDGTKYDIWTPEEYEVTLIIDNREIRSQKERDFFQTRLTNLGVECDVRPLSVGDVVWIAKNKQTGREVVLNTICERKRLDDLVSSIKDGRFQEQKNRLKKSGMKHFYYLVEEIQLTGVNTYGDMTDAIQTAMSITMTISDFYLKRFKSIEDTISFLASLTKVIKEKFAKEKTNLLVLKPRSIKNQAEYGQLIQQFRTKFEGRKTLYECVYIFSTFQDTMAKTGMMTVKEMFILMLMVVRGLSLERAVSIQNYFQTPKRFIEFYTVEHKHLPETQKKQLMMNLFKNEIGNKKIGKVLLEKIYDIWGCQGGKLN